jgi:hypothetical protein
VSAFQDVIERLKEHAVTAGQAVQPVLSDVDIAFPLPKGRCVRLYWGGEVAPEFMGGDRTLNSQMVSDRIVVALMLPVSSASEAVAKSYVWEVTTFVRAFRRAVLADSSLSGLAAGIDMGHAAPDFTAIGGAWWLTVDIDFVVDFEEYDTGP